MPGRRRAAGFEDDAALIAAARTGDERAFTRITAPLRRELHVHCYRMLGSLDDADDAVQDTLLRAWRAIDRFEPRAPLRGWLYRIATNVCLSTLGDRRRRAESRLDPYPDEMLDELDPQTRVLERERVELAFVAAVQVLPARQRTALLLRDVLGWSARETAELLQTSVAGANSTLQRARTALQHERDAEWLTTAHAAPSDEVERELVCRFVDAWQRTDLDALMRLLTEDALLTMPPLPLRVRGRAAVREFLGTRPAGGQLHRFTLVPVGAAARPAVALYLDGAAHAVMTLGLRGERIAALTRFGRPSLVQRTGLPMSCPVGDGSSFATAMKERS